MIRKGSLNKSYCSVQMHQWNIEWLKNADLIFFRENKTINAKISRYEYWKIFSVGNVFIAKRQQTLELVKSYKFIKKIDLCQNFY